MNDVRVVPICHDQITVILFQVININQIYFKQIWHIWKKTALFMHCQISQFNSYLDTEFLFLENKLVDAFVPVKLWRSFYGMFQGFR